MKIHKLLLLLVSCTLLAGCSWFSSKPEKPVIKLSADGRKLIFSNGDGDETEEEAGAKPLPEMQLKEMSLPEMSVPEMSVPEIPVPEMSAPEMPVPEMSAPEMPVPEMSVPEM